MLTPLARKRLLMQNRHTSTRARLQASLQGSYESELEERPRKRRRSHHPSTSRVLHRRSLCAFTALVVCVALAGCWMFAVGGSNPAALLVLGNWLNLLPVGRDCGMPVNLTQGMRKILLESVRGQDAPLHAMLDAMEKSRGEPLLVFLEGASGTGKSYTLSLLAHQYPKDAICQFSSWLMDFCSPEEGGLLEAMLQSCSAKCSSCEHQCLLLFDDVDGCYKHLAPFLVRSLARLGVLKVTMILAITSALPGYNMNSGLAESHRVAEFVSRLPNAHHIRFEPLNRSTVEWCVRVELARTRPMSSDRLVQSIAGKMEYVLFGNRTVSLDGCKRVASRVSLLVH